MKSQSRAALRRASDQIAALDGQPAGPAPAVPELLARAVAIVEAHPGADFWAGGLHTVVGSMNLCRLYRPSRLRTLGAVDLIVLYSPDVVGPAFPVATRVGDRYVSMTDVRGFAAWLALYGGGR